MMKILILDIETAPKLSYVWRFYKENIGAKQVLKHGHIMSFAAKWLGDSQIFYEENRKEDDVKIVTRLLQFLDEADVIVAHNGDRFDLPQISGRALFHGLTPPSPYKTIDTCKEARKLFAFPSNSLEYLGLILNVSVKKTSHKRFPGFELWYECLKGNEKAWEEMKEYNIDDVLSLEEIYLRMRPWIKSHPNITNHYVFQSPRCPKCAGEVHKRGFYHTLTARYQRYRCNNCGGWSRERLSDKVSRKVLTNAR